MYTVMYTSNTVNKQILFVLLLCITVAFTSMFMKEKTRINRRYVIIEVQGRQYANPVPSAEMHCLRSLLSKLCCTRSKSRNNIWTWLKQQWHEMVFTISSIHFSVNIPATRDGMSNLGLFSPSPHEKNFSCVYSLIEANERNLKLFYQIYIFN